MPAPFVANGDLFVVRVCCQSGDQIGLNDFAYVADLTSGTVPLPDLVTAMDLDFRDAYKDWLSNFAEFYGISLIRISPSPTGPFVSADLRGGLDLAPVMPRQAAALITKRTGVAGRTGRGRVYIPFGGVDFITNEGHITAGGQTQLGIIAGRTMVTQIYDLGGGNTTTLIPHLFHRPTLTSSEIVAVTLRTKIATQKRRGDYGRPNNLPW